MSVHLADVWESMAEALPDGAAVIQGARQVTWRAYEDRAARLARVFHDHGLTRDSKVGLYLYNCPEYLEAQFGAFKIRAVPVNVNYRYLDDELAYLLDNADAEALVYHASLADRVRGVRDRLPKLRLLVEVDDLGRTGAVLENVLSYEEALAAVDPLPPVERAEDDLYLLYTGGTTGLPKGVMYEVGDVARSFLHTASGLYGLPPVTDGKGATAAALALRDQGRQPVTLAGPPLMHGAGMWIGAITPHLFGGPVVLTEGRSFDAEAVVRAVASHRVTVLTIVGDAFARPMLDVLDRLAAEGAPADLGSLAILASSGAILSEDSKRRLFEHAPHMFIADLLGSSEGSMGMKLLTKDSENTTASFSLNPGTKVFLDDDTEVAPGSGQIGSIALTGAMVPKGYYRDEAKSARTFREIDGVRYSFPGDMATVEADGSIRLLGRGSTCINTGGEKVYAEEVEEALKTHSAVADCLVFGVDDERFGQRVAAVVSLVPGADRPAESMLIDHAKARLAGYKAPRDILVVEGVPRGPNGKADYRSARALFGGATAS